MNSQFANTIDIKLQLPKPFFPRKTPFPQFPHSSPRFLTTRFFPRNFTNRCKLRITASNSPSDTASPKQEQEQEQDAESAQLFEVRQKKKKTNKEKENNLTKFWKLRIQRFIYCMHFFFCNLFHWCNAMQWFCFFTHVRIFGLEVVS